MRDLETPERRRPTQADVARAAGVSQATVSMALNAGPEVRGRLTEETRLRILGAVEETGYWGNMAAKHLAGGRVSVFGVFTYEPVFPHDSGDFYHPFLRGIEAEALSQDVDLLLFTSSHGEGAAEGRDGLRDWARRGRLRLADGCILFGRHSHRRDLTELLAHDYPFVFIGRREADGAEVPYVGADYAGATEQVVDLLVDHGHRRVALALEFPEHESGIDRRQGFDRATARHGVQVLHLDGASADADALLDDVLGTGTTALVATPDLAARIRLLALSRGLSLPADLSIARLGDPEARHTSGVDWSGFTTPRHEMGAAAVRLLHRLVQDRARPGDTQFLLPCTVTPGSTTGPARGGHIDTVHPLEETS